MLHRAAVSFRGAKLLCPLGFNPGLLRWLRYLFTIILFTYDDLSSLEEGKDKNAKIFQFISIDLLFIPPSSQNRVSSWLMSALNEVRAKRDDLQCRHSVALSLE